MLLTARYVVPLDGAPIEGGGVVLHEERILEVGSASRLQGEPRVDYGDAVILPGFVNAHTHLELSFLAGRISPSLGFPDWIRRVAGELLSSAPSPEQTTNAVREGIRQSLSAGVTTVGDITRAPNRVRPVLAGSPLRCVSFGEVIGIGLGRSRWPDRLQEAASTEFQTPRLRIGVSPHAPYTVEPAGLRACADRAGALDLPLCTHVAETIEEESFTRALEGPLVQLLRGAGVWDEGMTPSGRGPVELCDASGLLGPRTLLAHANYVTDEDIRRIADRGAGVVYCPRTHAAFGHRPHRFRDMLRAGITLAIGTDSLASNPSLSVLEELRFLRAQHPDLPPAHLLALGTRNGAAVLGLADVTGTITPRKAADLVVVPLTETDRGWERILEPGSGPCAVYVAGRPIVTNSVTIL